MLRGTGSIMMNDWRLDMMHYPTVWNDGVVPLLARGTDDYHTARDSSEVVVSSGLKV